MFNIFFYKKNRLILSKKYVDINADTRITRTIPKKKEWKKDDLVTATPFTNLRIHRATGSSRRDSTRNSSREKRERKKKTNRMLTHRARHHQYISRASSVLPGQTKTYQKRNNNIGINQSRLSSSPIHLCFAPLYIGYRLRWCWQR